MNRERYFNESISNTCQFCPSIIEDNNHILQCQCCTDLRNQAKEDWNLHIFDFLSQSYTPTSTRIALIMGINCWLNAEQIPSIHDILPNADSNLVQAYEHQTLIGWDNLFCGKVSIYWNDIIREHLKIWSIGSKIMAAARWASTFILELWKGVLTMWDCRNKEYFGVDNESRRIKEKQKLLQKAQHLKSLGIAYNNFDVVWFQKPLTELEQYSVISLKAWICNARTIVRLFHKEQKSRVDSVREAPIDHTGVEVSNMIPFQLSLLNVGEDRRIPLDLQGETILCGT